MVVRCGEAEVPLLKPDSGCRMATTSRHFQWGMPAAPAHKASAGGVGPPVLFSSFSGFRRFLICKGFCAKAFLLIHHQPGGRRMTLVSGSAGRGEPPRKQNPISAAAAVAPYEILRPWRELPFFAHVADEKLTPPPLPLRR